MVMSFPLNYFAELSPTVGLIVAFIIGIGFGFFLEKAGFGSARKLTAQFYLQDFSVLKVMFTAVVVAAIGFWGLVLVGFLDLSVTYINMTYIGAQAIGGLILGIGFVVGGYCPGTSCVAVSTGKIDAIVYLGGVVFGIFVYSEAAALLKPLQDWGKMGEVFVHDWMGVAPGVVVLIAVFMAVGSFALGTFLEKKKNGVIQPEK
jgi:uncharacterized protein